ncbi:MAG: hydrogenase maturation nickel metallochaperone HypA [Mycoplasmoidaceae bacterium]|nr:hydrogenase maturation nickel metallochaperone HypA [Mycoplasmoidaceae bacterium]
MAQYKCNSCQATFDCPEGKKPVCPLCQSDNVTAIKVGK